MNRTIALSAALLVSAVAWSGPASAKVKILFNTFEPLHNGIVSTGGILPWAAQVEKVTNGRVKVDIPPASLGPPPRQWDLVTQGVADGAYMYNAWMKQRILLPQIAQLPFNGLTAEAASVALWRTYKRYFEAAHEYKAVHLIGLCATAPSQLFTLGNKPIQSIDDIKGTKMFTTPDLAPLFQKVGAAAVVGPVVKIYDQVSKGIVDSAAGMAYYPAETFHAFPYLKTSTDFPGGIYTPTFSIFISKSKWAEISPKDQKAISRVSGEALAHTCGAYADKVERQAKAKFVADGKKRTTAPAKLVAALKKAWSGQEQNWLNDAKKRGVDGKAALAFYRAQLKKVGGSDQ